MSPSNRPPHSSGGGGRGGVRGGAGRGGGRQLPVPPKNIILFIDYLLIYDFTSLFLGTV